MLGKILSLLVVVIITGAVSGLYFAFNKGKSTKYYVLALILSVIVVTIGMGQYYY